MITESEYLLAKQIVIAYEKQKETTPYWKALVDEWFRFYQFDAGKNTEPNFTNGEQPALKRLMKKIRKKAEDAKIEWSEESSVTSLQIFLKASLKESFTAKNFTLRIIDSRFDIIYANAKQQSPQQKDSQRNQEIASRIGAQ